MITTQVQKILIVDDSADNRQVLSDLFKADYTVILAKNGEQALERARQHLPDLILLDVLMSDMSGLDVLKQLQADQRTAGITVIFITRLDTPEDEVSGLTQGAIDYITKPFVISVVKARVKTQMRLIRQRANLLAMANIDGLTNISNRRHFNTLFDAEWSRAQRSNEPLSIAMLDIDYFKSYNDHFGHAQGDRVLQLVAQVLATCLKRPADMVARYGGEEFVLMMPDTNSEGSLKIAESIRLAIEQVAIPHPHSLVGSCVTVSIGLVSSDAVAVLSSIDLLKIADDRLYKAKSAGRNQIVFN